MATIAQLRLLMNDPAGASQIFDDDAYQLAIDTESNIYRAGAMIARMFASYYAQKVSTTVGPVKLDNDQKYNHYVDLADSFDKRAQTGGGASGEIGTGIELTGVSISEMDTQEEDDDRYPSAFKRGMNDNPSAGIDEATEDY